MVLRRPSGFIEPCQPSKAARPPSGPLWVHEIKHDGYRLMVRRDGSRVRCFTRNGHDWADHFTGIVDAASRIKATSFLIDGEVVITSDDGMSDFRALRSKRRGHEAVLFAFDLIEHDGTDLRDLPLIERKRRLAKLIGKAKRRSIQFVQHLTGDGPIVFDHVCRLGLEGIVSKRADTPYRSGPSKCGSRRKTRRALLAIVRDDEICRHMARERAQRILRLAGRRRDRVPLALVAEMQERHEHKREGGEGRRCENEQAQAVMKNVVKEERAESAGQRGR